MFPGRTATVAALAASLVVIDTAAAGERVEVPAERAGRLVIVGTEVRPGAVLPRNEVQEAVVPFLAIAVPPGTKVAPEDEAIVGGAGRKYRRWKEGDDLPPGNLAVSREARRFRRLHLGDRVKEGQFVGLVNPALAGAELSRAVARLEMAEVERAGAARVRDREQRLYRAKEHLRRVGRGCFSDDELRGAKRSWERTIAVEQAIAARVRQAQAQVRAALTVLRLHEVRSTVAGVVTEIYKSRGEAVRLSQAVVQMEE